MSEPACCAKWSIVVADLQGGYEIINPMMVTSPSVSETAAGPG